MDEELTEVAFVALASQSPNTIATEGTCRGLAEALRLEQVPIHSECLRKNTYFKGKDLKQRLSEAIYTNST